MPSQAIIVPQAQAKVLEQNGVFSTVWYRFFQALAKEVPQIGDCIVQAMAPVSNGWLACDGAEVNRTAYSALFAVIGTSYGPGDGMTTFNLPNFASIGAPSFWKIRYQ